MILVNKCAHFFKNLGFRLERLLLGLSGGPDSMALLHLLLEMQREVPFELGIAHVDHNWRPESNAEASFLEAMSKTLKLPFYLKTLDPSTLKGNLEQACRENRLAFFKKICEEKKYQAILLAHHAGDQAETVLKRCLEGCHLSNLAGMEEMTKILGITILRPLLKVQKRELLEYLDRQNVNYFQDPTNLDSRYLRGRMRLEIFKELESKFGKNVQNSLCRIAEEAAELRAFFKKTAAAFLEKSTRSSLGLHVDFSSIESSFEMRSLLQELLSQENISLSHTQLNIALAHLIAKSANRRIVAKENSIFLDRGHLFILKKATSDLSLSSFPIKPGNFNFGSWQVEVRKAQKNEPQKLGWRHVFKGCCIAVLPAGNYTLNFDSSSLDRKWTNAKVPAFLRAHVPNISNNREVVQEFLTGRSQVKIANWEEALVVSLYRE